MGFLSFVLLYLVVAFLLSVIWGRFFAAGRGGL